jgi:chromosome segregation ATPase
MARNYQREKAKAELKKNAIANAPSKKQALENEIAALSLEVDEWRSYVDLAIEDKKQVDMRAANSHILLRDAGNDIMSRQHTLAEKEAVVNEKIQELQACEQRSSMVLREWRELQRGSSYLQNLAKKKELEETLDELRGLQNREAVKPMIAHVEQQIRALDAVTEGALQAYATELKALWGLEPSFSEQKNEPRIHTKPSEPDYRTQHGRPRGNIPLNTPAYSISTSRCAAYAND